LLSRCLVGSACRGLVVSGVGLANDGREGQVELGAGQRRSIDNDPRSPLVRRNQVVGGNSGGVHQWVSISGRANSRVASSASGDDIPVNTVLVSAVLGSRSKTSIARELKAVEEGPPGRNKGGGVEGWVVFLSAGLIHVANALVVSMLASKGP